MIARRGVLAVGVSLLATAVPGMAAAMVPPGAAIDPATGLVLAGSGRVDMAASARALSALAQGGDGGAVRASAMLATLAAVRHCSAIHGAGGCRGHVYAWLDPRTLTRSDGAIVDFRVSAAMMAAVQAAGRRWPALADRADQLAAAVDGDWARGSGAHGWSPEIGFV